jgi:hypothetical protein
MAASEGISLEQLRVLSERAGLRLAEAELAALKPLYDHYARLVPALFAVDLEAEDLAVMYTPNWEPQS